MSAVKRSIGSQWFVIFVKMGSRENVLRRNDLMGSSDNLTRLTSNSHTGPLKKTKTKKKLIVQFSSSPEALFCNSTSRPISVLALIYQSAINV